MKTVHFFLNASILISVGASVYSRTSHAQADEQVNKTISPDAMNQIQALIKEKASRTPAQKKIDSQLLVASKMRRDEAIASAVPTLTVNVEADDQGTVDVVITARVEPKLLAELGEWR